MKYVQPYGVSDQDSPYINGDPSIGRQGSIPPAAAFEHPMREIVNVITKNKIAPDAADLGQLLKAVRSQRVNYVQDTGSVNTLSVALDPPLDAYTVGLPLKVQIRETCTGGSTIDAGAGRVPVKLMNGGSTGAGDLPAGGICELVYDGAAFQLVNFFGLGGVDQGDIVEFLIKIPYTVDVSSTPNIVQANFSPAINVLPTAGDAVLVKQINTNTGSSILRVNALGVDFPIKANGGGLAGLIQGDMQAGDVVLYVFDGTNWWIQPNPLISADTTINVPAQYSSVENALLAIRRKIIAQNAMVTVLLAGAPAGQAPIQYPPFVINHGNADRITVRGTLKSPGVLSSGNFAQTGNTPAARTADSANNIAMLRNKYGTEIVMPATDGFGITSVAGSGRPTVADMLVTGPNYWSGAGIGKWNGCSGRDVNYSNVSCWGLDIGFYAGAGTLILQNCFACGCFRNGFQATGGAKLAFNQSGTFGNVYGASVNQNSVITTFQSWVNYNGSNGVSVFDFAEFTLHSSQAQGNGGFDISVGGVSYLIALNSRSYGGWGTSSPAPGYMNAYGGLFVEDGL